MKKLAIMFVALAFITSVAVAKKYPHTGAKVSVNVPNSWKVSGDDDSLTAESADGAAALMFFVLEAESLDAALEGLDTELSKIITNFKEDGEPSEVSVKGMPGVAVDGEGTIEGQRCKIGLLVLKSPSGKAVLVLGAAQKSKYKKHKKALEKILSSLKPL